MIYLFVIVINIINQMDTKFLQNTIISVTALYLLAGCATHATQSPGLPSALQSSGTLSNQLLSDYQKQLLLKQYFDSQPTAVK